MSRSIRTLHRFLGLFTAPAILFFAFTGALQTLSLHDAAKDGSYKPPAWLLSMAQLHKKQTIHVVTKKARNPQGEDAQQAHGHEPKPANDAAQPDKTAGKSSTLAMKFFFVVVSVALIVSTITGIQTAWAFSKQRKVMVGVLAAGVVVPITLLFL